MSPRERPGGLGLVLKPGDALCIGQHITAYVTLIRPGRLRLVIDAPPEFEIRRAKLEVPLNKAQGTARLEVTRI